MLYSLIERGRALHPALNELYAWDEEQIELDNL
ncbi:hypothetical protein [Petroclostridium sp. X23]